MSAHTSDHLKPLLADTSVRPAWMRWNQTETRRRRYYLPSLLLLLVFLLTSLYTFVDLGTVARTLVSYSYSEQQDVVWQTIGAIDPHLRPGRSDTLGDAAIVKPFFHKARRGQGLSEGDVTIFSMATADRLDMVEMLADQYQGPISLAFWVPATDEEARKAALAKLKHLTVQSQSVNDWIDFHLVIEDRKLELNRWRNVARRYARTDYVLMHDVDFWLPPWTRARFAEPALQAALKEGKQAFAIPCFVGRDNELAVQPHRFPESKPGVIDLVKSGKFDMPNPQWQPGHGAINYPHWYTLPENSTDYYKIASPHASEFEPYLLMNTHTSPYCTEVLSQWSEKAACVWEMHVAGVDLRVLPGAYSMHVGIKKPNVHNGKFDWSKREFENWKRETCHRSLGYLSKYQLLETDMAKQWQDACFGYPGIKQLRNELLDTSRRAVREGDILR